MIPKREREIYREVIRDTREDISTSIFSIFLNASKGQRKTAIVFRAL